MITTCMAGMSIPAYAMAPDPEPDTSTYTITIPSTLTVENSGWNSIGNISASGTLADGKKLTVSAASANSWALTSTSDSVSYTLKNASTDNAATTSWEFTKEQLSTGATQAIGIDVSDYSSKPAGTYTDTVTFTASVKEAQPEYYNKLTSGAGTTMNQIMLLKELGRGRRAYNSSLTAAQAYALATYQAAIDGKAVYVIMSSQDDGYEIHYALSTDTAATEHTSELYDMLGMDLESAGLNMYYGAQ